MSLIFVHELENVRKRLEWNEDGSLNEEQHELLRSIVLCERRLKGELEQCKNCKDYFEEERTCRSIHDHERPISSLDGKCVYVPTRFRPLEGLE